MNQNSTTKLRWLTQLGVISCVCLGVLVFSGLFSPIAIERGGDSLTVHLDHASYLRPGGKICFRGVPIGSIVSMELINPDGKNIARAQSIEDGKSQIKPPQVRVLGSIRQGIRKFITDDSVLEIITDPLRNTYLDIQPGKGTPISLNGVLQLQHDPILEPAAEYLRTVKSLRNTAETMNEILELFIAEDGLNETLRTLGDAGHSVRDTAEEFRILIRDGRAPVLSSMQQAEEILIELRAHSQSLPEVLDAITRAGRTAEDMLRSADLLLHENRAPFRETIENLQYTSENLHALAAELRRRPWRILNAPGDRESAFIALHECANRYAEGALEVRRATEQVRDLLDRRGEDTEVLEKLETALKFLGDRLTRQADLEKTLLQRTHDLAAPR